MLPDFKTLLIWALGLALVAALAGNSWQAIRVATIATELATEKARRATENEARANLATEDANTVAGAQGQHATTQQGITHELTEAKAALAAAGSGNRALAGRLRDTSATLTAARDRAEANADAAACGSGADQHRDLFGLLEEAGRLSAESGELAGEGRQLLVKREAEVRALKALVLADRALMERAAGSQIAPR